MEMQFNIRTRWVPSDQHYQCSWVTYEAVRAKQTLDMILVSGRRRWFLLSLKKKYTGICLCAPHTFFLIFRYLLCRIIFIIFQPSMSSRNVVKTPACDCFCQFRVHSLFVQLPILLFSRLSYCIKTAAGRKYSLPFESPIYFHSSSCNLMVSHQSTSSAEYSVYSMELVRLICRIANSSI